jgi:lysophospholipase L1-like esterase
MKMSQRTFYLLALMTLLAVVTAAAEERGGERRTRYLALGDSVAFGFIAQAGFAYGNPDNFVGYPDYAARMLHSDLVNAGCPGETTGSFLSLSAPDNGCAAFRKSSPLHVGYGLTQLDFATNYLEAHRATKLVTIDLGANDAFLLQGVCAQTADPAGCLQSGLPGLLGMIGQNMETILTALRETGFKGVIVVVNYYSLDYSDQAQNALSLAINAVLASVASANGAVVADVFTAFHNALPATLTGNNFTCKAGLLNASAQNQFFCDIHPSQSGAKLIGKTVAAAYAKAADRNRD